MTQSEFDDRLDQLILEGRQTGNSYNNIEALKWMLENFGKIVDDGKKGE